MMNRSPIDTHCHFFNGVFAFKELVEILSRRFVGNYPYAIGKRPPLADKSFTKREPELQELAAYVASLFVAAAKSPQEHYDHEQLCYSASSWGAREPLVTVPLMMDIYFVLDKGEPRDKGALDFSPLVMNSEESHAFEKIIRKIKADVIRSFDMQKTLMSRKGMFSATKTENVDRQLDAVIRALEQSLEKGVMPFSSIIPSGVQLTWGFRDHLEELELLHDENPETVLPFLAVDPRRKGIVSLVREKVINGCFKGIKLYPPLGYFPTHPDLYPIYDLCIEHDVPVTVHAMPKALDSLCSEIYTMRKRDGSLVEEHYDRKYGQTPSDFFAEPDNWRELLRDPRYSNIRLNFAHFGGMTHIEAFADNAFDSSNWTHQIVKLMNEYENVYADCSYCSKGRIMQWINCILDKEPRVKERLMFGTDYLMVLVDTELEHGLKGYFDSYRHCPEDMFLSNPRKFLNLSSTNYPESHSNQKIQEP